MLTLRIMKGSRGGRHSDADAQELVAGCEAFLAGRYVEHLVDTRQGIPPWAWTNLLAHGTEEQLRCPPADLGVDLTGRTEAWCKARAYLAAEVLESASRQGSLEKLQTEVLIPLELVARPAACFRRPSDWLVAVLRAVAPLPPVDPRRTA